MDLPRDVRILPLDHPRVAELFPTTQELWEGGCPNAECSLKEAEGLVKAHGRTKDELHQAIRSGQVKALRIGTSTPEERARARKRAAPAGALLKEVLQPESLEDLLRTGTLTVVEVRIPLQPRDERYAQHGLDPSDPRGVILVNVASLRAWHEAASS
jgi:hypothetical protein